MSKIDNEDIYINLSDDTRLLVVIFYALMFILYMFMIQDIESIGTLLISFLLFFIASVITIAVVNKWEINKKSSVSIT